MTRPRAPASAAYDRIGIGYAAVRRADPRIEARVHRGLGGARRIVDVGAGAGSYEPTDRTVVAVEPSSAMIAQRGHTAAPVVRAVAGQLPFPDGCFDGAMAMLTVHHWPDPIEGLTEVRRVTTGPIVVFTFDNEVHAHQWLVTDYLPAIADLDLDNPSAAQIADALGGGVVEVVPIPRDCVDGFCHAWWARPEAYLDPTVRAGISGIARLPATDVQRAMGRLARDLADGTWQAAHADLIDRDEIDAGYRLVISPGSP